MKHIFIKFFILLLCIMVGVFSGKSFAQQQTINVPPNDQPAQRLADIFAVDPLKPEWFVGPDYIKAVDPVKKQIIQRLGQPVAIEKIQPTQYKLIFKDWYVVTHIGLDEQQKISMIWFGTPIANKPQNLDDVLAEFKSLSGDNAILVTRNGQVLIESKSQDKKAVASAFKLGVLAVLQQYAQQNKLRWEQTVPGVANNQRSLPTGLLQDFPENSPMTLSTLASLMIFISDNTATDILIDILGRKDIEKVLEIPLLLKTREIFILKDPKNQDLLTEWSRAAGFSTRRELLREVNKRPLPSIEIFMGGTVLAPEIEWFISNEKLCHVIKQVADLPLFQINPGLAERNDWVKIAYKGGSEPGVLNLTTWLQAKNGDVYCVSVTWNDEKPLPEEKYMLWYKLLLKTLSQMSQK